MQEIATYYSSFIHHLRHYTGGFPSAADLEQAGFSLKLPDETLLRRASTLSAGVSDFQAKPAPLVSVFQVLNGANSSQLAGYPYAVADVDKEAMHPGLAGMEYAALVERFSAEFKNLPKGSDFAFAESLVFLAKKYFTFVGAGSQAPHLSAFEYVKTAAAFAAALHLADNPEQPFLLVGAGFDGIQAFCYDMVSSKAARTMKGRSFYMQLLMESLIQRMMWHPDIQASNGQVLYARGGKMTALLPNRKEVVQALQALEVEIHQQLLDEYRGRLHVYLGWVAFDGNEAHLSDTLSRLDQVNGRKKRQKFRPVIADRFSKLFKPVSAGFDTGADDVRICSVTGERIENPDPEEHDLTFGSDEEEKVWVSARIKEIKTLGDRLQRADALISSPDSFESTDTHEPVYLGAWHQLADNSRPASAKKGICKTINTVDSFEMSLPGNIARGFMYYGGNRQAVKSNGQLKFFHELADFYEGQPNPGFHRLGVVRIDLDRLGSSLKAWFDSTPSWAAYSTVSAHLDYFLSGYINKIRNSEAYADYVNILFAGGDDALIIGRWDKALEFTLAVRTAFQVYIDGPSPVKRSLTMSAGIVLVNPKYPISKANETAGEVLDKAKTVEVRGSRRNAVSLFGQIIQWGEEFDEMTRLKRQIVDLTASTILPDSFLQAVQQFQVIKNIHLHDRRDAGQVDLSFLWNSAYYIKRLEDRLKSKLERNAAARDFLQMVKLSFIAAMHNDCRFYDVMATAARWAELELRANTSTTSST